MNEETSILSPQSSPTPVQKDGLQNLSPNSNYNVPSTTRNFPVSDPNLKPLEVNLPKDAPVQSQPIQTSPTQPVTIPSPTAPPVAQDKGFTAVQPLQPLTAEAEQPQIFVNPNPPVQSDITGVPTSDNPFGLNQGGSQAPPPPTEAPVNNSLPKSHFNKGILLIIVLLVLFLGGGGFFLNEFVLNKLTNLQLISENSQFYLTLAVKKNPQADKAKSTIKKFPGGDQILKQFDKYYTQFTGTDPKNVLNDLTQYATTELLFARESRATDNSDTSERLINIVDTGSVKEAQDGINNFADDTATYKVTKDMYKGVTYSDIKLLSEQKLYESQIKNSANLKYSLSTPKPQSRIATNIDKFIFSSDKVDDVKMAIDLSQAKKVFGISTGNSPKSILDSIDHQKISSLFPKETFVKFFARDPITPYSSIGPFFGTSVTTSANAAETEANDFQKTTRGLDSYFTDDGLKIDAYALDNSNSQNSFAINQSLATKLPQKFAGVAPTLYAETQNLQAQWKNQIDFATTMKDSKSRSQREQFTSFLDSTDQMKKSYKDTYGIDYETDILSWLDGQVGFIFNAGKSKKGPELLVVAEIKDQKKVEDSLKKISVKDPYAESNDLKRQSDLRQIMTGLQVYYTMNYQYPASLANLVTADKNTTYLTTIPKDPVTKKDYSYSPTADKQDFTLSASLDNGQTLTYDNNATAKLTGVKKDLRTSPKPSSYKTTSIYQMPIYSYSDINYSFYFTVTKNKAVIALSDSDQSLKDIIDFESSPSSTLAQNSAWQNQFSKINGNVNDIAFVEPINLMGFMDYLKGAYPQYKDMASSYSPGSSTYFDDIEKVAKGYLKTIPSIGAVSGQNKDVSYSRIFVNVVELPTAEKKDAEDALGRLLKTDDSNQYKSVLGINSETTFDKVKKDWNKFFNGSLKPIFTPQGILSN